MKNHTASFISIPRMRPANPATPTVQAGIEINVVFTDTRATLAALQYAGSLASDLGANLRLRAGIVVPLRLPLNEPQISVAFTRNLLAGLISQVDAHALSCVADVYVCRDWSETLLEVLDINAPVVIGRTHRWWPGPERKLAKALRSHGYQVIVADRRSRTAFGHLRQGAAPEFSGLIAPSKATHETGQSKD